MSPSKNPSTLPSPRSRAIIVAWVICTLTTLFVEFATIVLIIIQSFVAPSPRLGALATLLILAAICSGLLGLILLPFVVRYGRGTVPRQATLISMVICGLPLLLVIGLFLATSGS